MKYEITHYQVIQYAGGRKYPISAVINLYGKADAHVGKFKFYRKRDQLPDKDSKASSGFVTCHLGSEQFIEIVDILRNEKPVYLLYSDEHSLGTIATDAESVGEEEITDMGFDIDL